MLSRFDLREYRLLRHLSLRDVARYCDVSHELIGKVENGEVSVTKYNHDQIVQGINRASQAIVDGTFNALKEESQKIKEEREKLKAKKAISSKNTNTTTKKTTARKSAKADTNK